MRFCDLNKQYITPPTRRLGKVSDSKLSLIHIQRTNQYNPCPCAKIIPSSQKGVRCEEVLSAGISGNLAAHQDCDDQGDAGADHGKFNHRRRRTAAYVNEPAQQRLAPSDG